MSSNWKTVRVFISSTFRDIHAERDHLVKEVFPRLRQWCEERRLHLIDIDLRWGVTAEEAENGKAIDICLHEIDGSRPFFLCILGGRYGWVPDALPPKSRFQLKGAGREGLSITHLEILHSTQKPLAPDEGKTPDPCRHAFFYFRKPGCLPVPESLPECPPDERRRYAECYFETSPELKKRLAELKDEISRQFSRKNRVYEYEAVWEPALDSNELGRGRLTGLNEFGLRVEENLKRAIGEEFAAHISDLGESVNPQDEERTACEAFIENCTRVHVPRIDVEKKLSAYLEGEDPRPLVLSGAPGSGKSAILAHFVRVRGSKKGGGFVLARFIGASPAATNLHCLLENLCLELRAAFDLEQSLRIPSDPEELEREWPNFLRSAGEKGAVILVLDAVNQLDRSADPGRLNWLPGELPRGVRLVLSVLDPGETREDDAGWLDALRAMRLPEIPVPKLSDAQRLRIIRELPNVFCKTLDKTQVTALLRNAATRNPLFLCVALEELRLFGSYEGLPREIAALPRLEDPDISGDMEKALSRLFGRMLDRLERETGREAPGLAAALFRALASARTGLTEAELDGVLSASETIPERARRNAVQSVLRQVRAYLVRKGMGREAVVDFYHRSFWKAAREKYLSDPLSLRNSHRRLAGYFTKLPFRSVRKLIELPWQLNCGALRKKLEALLCRLDFIEAKCGAGLIFDLLDDYRDALESRPAGARSGSFDAFADFVSRQSHLLASPLYNAVLLARNHASAGPVVRAAETLAEKRKEPWVARDPRPQARLWQSACLKTIKTSAHTVALTADAGRAVVGGELDVSVWDLRTGQCLRSMEGFVDEIYSISMGHAKRRGKDAAKLAGHSHKINRVVLAPDGKTAVSASDDDTLRIWNLDSGVSRTLVGHPDGVSSVALIADGSRAVSVGGDLRVWDLKTAKCVSSFPGDGTCLALTADGGLALTGSWEGPLSLWDVTAGKLRRTLTGHSDAVYGVAMSPDGRIAASGGSDGLRVWDIASGRCLHELHKEWVYGVTFSPDSSTLISAEFDKCLRVWDPASGACLHTLYGHTDKVFSVAITPDMRRAASAGDDGSLRLWDLAIDSPSASGVASGGPFIRTIEHVRLSHDGRHAATVGFDSVVRVWDTETGGVLSDLDDVDGRPAAIKAKDGGFHLWDSVSGAGYMGLPDGGRSEITCLSPDGSVAVSKTEDYRLRVWDTSSGATLRTLLKGRRFDLTTAALSADGRILLTDGGESEPMTWDLASGEFLRRFEGHESTVQSAALTPDGAAGVTVAYDGGLCVWSLRSGSALRTLHAVEEPGLLVLTPDGRTALLPRSDHALDREHDLHVFDLAGGGYRVLRGHTGAIHRTAVTPDGRFALTASEDGTVRVWELASDRCAAWYPADSGVTTLFRVQPDGRFAAGTTDGDLLLLGLRKLTLGPPVVTAVRLFRHGGGNGGSFEKAPSALCPWCVRRFSLDPTVLDAVGRGIRLKPEQSPCLELPASAWEEPSLLSECPHCNEAVRFNPFIPANIQFD